MAAETTAVAPDEDTPDTARVGLPFKDAGEGRGKEGMVLHDQDAHPPGDRLARELRLRFAHGRHPLPSWAAKCPAGKARTCFLVTIRLQL